MTYAPPCNCFLRGHAANLNAMNFYKPNNNSTIKTSTIGKIKKTRAHLNRNPLGTL